MFVVTELVRVDLCNCKTTGTKLLSKITVNKNALQKDAYRPRIDRIPVLEGGGSQTLEKMGDPPLKMGEPPTPPPLKNGRPQPDTPFSLDTYQTLRPDTPCENITFPFGKHLVKRAGINNKSVPPIKRVLFLRAPGYNEPTNTFFSGVGSIYRILCELMCALIDFLRTFKMQQMEHTTLGP